MKADYLTKEDAKEFVTKQYLNDALSGFVTKQYFTETINAFEKHIDAKIATIPEQLSKQIIIEARDTFWKIVPTIFSLVAFMIAVTITVTVGAVWFVVNNAG